MSRQLASVILTILSLFGCTSDAAPLTDPNSPKAGLWEVNVELISMDPMPPGMTLDSLAAELGMNEAERQCSTGKQVAVGDTIEAGQCRYTRVADRGNSVDRTGVCSQNRMTRWTGTRSIESYDFRIEQRQRNSIDGREDRTVVVRERGRWLGACEQGG